MNLPSTLDEVKSLSEWVEFAGTHKLVIKWPESTIHETMGIIKVRNKKFCWYRKKTCGIYQKWYNPEGQGQAFTLEEAKARIEEGWIREEYFGIVDRE
jgi:hypothetical protein